MISYPASTGRNFVGLFITVSWTPLSMNLHRMRLSEWLTLYSWATSIVSQLLLTGIRVTTWLSTRLCLTTRRRRCSLISLSIRYEVLFTLWSSCRLTTPVGSLTWEQLHWKSTKRIFFQGCYNCSHFCVIFKDFISYHKRLVSPHVISKILGHLVTCDVTETSIGIMKWYY